MKKFETWKKFLKEDPISKDIKEINSLMNEETADENRKQLIEE